MTTDRTRRLDRLAGYRGAPAGLICWTRIDYAVPDATTHPGEVRRAHAYFKVRGGGLAANPDVGKWERRPGETEAAFVQRIEGDIRQRAAGRAVFAVGYT